jgi:hypothetical protein
MGTTGRRAKWMPGGMARAAGAALVVAAACGGLTGVAEAQALGAVVVEATGGRADFIDDGPLVHAIGGGSARWHLTPRLAIGPEVIYMVGPGSDRDLFVTGNVTYDFVGPRRAGRDRVVPYVVAGAGFFRHTSRFGPRGFATTEGAFTGGGGARVWVSDRVYVGGEARFGWEPHTRYTATMGVRLR